MRKPGKLENWLGTKGRYSIILKLNKHQHYYARQFWLRDVVTLLIGRKMSPKVGVEPTTTR